jgi:hypothetical protein
MGTVDVELVPDPVEKKVLAISVVPEKCLTKNPPAFKAPNSK